MDLDPVDGCGESLLRVLLRSHSDSTKKGQSAQCCQNRPVPPPWPPPNKDGCMFRLLDVQDEQSKMCPGLIL